jgi:FolB domain-containing protein
MTNYASALMLHHLTLSVHLGYGDEERATPQLIVLDITFYLSNLPLAARADGEGFLCYDALTQYLKTVINDREFQLIEYLTPYLGQHIKSWLGARLREVEVEHAAFTLTLFKPEAPVAELRGGASFTYTTLPQGLV